MHPTEAILILCHIKSYLCFMFRNKLSVREQSETDSRNSDVSDEINYIYIYIGEIHSIEQDWQDIYHHWKYILHNYLEEATMAREDLSP